MAARFDHPILAAEDRHQARSHKSIKERVMTGLGLSQAVHLVDAAPTPIQEEIARDEAERTRLQELPHAIEAASPARREELTRIVVQQVVVRDRQVQSITWTPAARPFFEIRQRECPQGDSNP